MRHPSSFFIAVEGLDGSGKTECTRKCVALAQSLGVNATATYEPEDSCCAGGFIRKMLRKEIAFSAHTLALAYAANRADHLDRIVLPALSQPNALVMSDRYYLSSLVYQSSDSFSHDDVMALNRTAIAPDLTLFFEVSAETARQRIAQRGMQRELFESRLNETRAKYTRAIAYIRARGEHVEIIDANQPMDAVIAAMQSIIARHRPRTS